MRKTALFLAGALVLPVLLAGCASPADPAGASPVPAESAAISAAPEETSSGEPGGILSSFTASDLEGNEVDASLFEDYELTMVNVWATFCTPCISEMPELGELSAEYAGQGVQVVGLISDALNSDGTVSDGQLDTAREIVEATGASYRHLVPSEDLYGLLAQITSVPTTFFVDSTGAQVGYAYLGARSGEEWAAILDELLTEGEP